jgi:L-asparaginase
VDKGDAMILLVNSEGRSGFAAARERLQAGAAALDAVEAGIRLVEADPAVHSVGRGGDPNLLGEMECDAAIMDGATRRAGAVGALRGYLHAISVARQVMERLPHVFLAGEGAAHFAREIGAEPAELLTPEARVRHAAWLERYVAPSDRGFWPAVPLAPYAHLACEHVRTRGTTVYLAVDARGELAAGVSSSGWSQKYPGRLGDSPVIGAGLYADRRYGACGCTHTGEMAIRAGTARAVVLHMQRGAPVEEACREALEDVRALQGGLLGPLTIHAIDRGGEPCVMSLGDPGERIAWLYWRAGMTEAEERRPVRCV